MNVVRTVARHSPCHRFNPPLLTRRVPSSPISGAAATTRSFSHSVTRRNDQSKQIDKIYDDLTTTTPTPSAPPAALSAREPTPEERARAVFGTHLTGTERQAERDSVSKLVAGVLVPPKPEEPDNCCMSGCVNCVWDRYSEEMNEWISKSADAKAAMDAGAVAALDARQSQEMRVDGSPPLDMKPKIGGDSLRRDGARSGGSVVDDNGVDSKALGKKSGTQQDSGLNCSIAERDPFEDMPVGIREFMRMEKKTKERKAAAVAAAASAAATTEILAKG